MSDYINIEKKQHIYVMTLNRPEKMNALSYENLLEIEETVNTLSANKDCKVLIITGTGRAFCAGADVSQSGQNTLSPQEKTVANSRLFKKVFHAIEYARPFTIAAINGYALGGGLEMALACDIRVASMQAKMGIVESAIGSFPGGGGTQRLPRLIGLGKAKEMLATAEKISAEEAFRIGLVEHISEHENLIETCKEIAKKICVNSTNAIAGGKRLMSMGVEMDIDKALDYETAWLGFYAESPDRLEGRKAFREKRKPVFE